MTSLSAGDHVIAGDDLYGGTYRLFTRIFSRLGIEFDFVDLTNPANLSPLIRPNTRLLWLETPTNPLLKIVNIEAVCRIARAHGLLSVVDNTFATPYLQQPLLLGADAVVHSTTKYMGGHSDVVGGIVITNHDGFAEQIGYISNATGGIPGPMDAFLVLRGIKTLHLRMERHVSNAIEIANFLQHHPQVDRVIYPGLKEHPHHDLCTRQMRGPGGMISFIVKGGKDAAFTFTKNTQLFACAESLGGVESLIGHPVTMTHAAIPKDIRENLGITDGFIRLSVGIENAQDLINDLQIAFKSIN